jgi:SAM-dependent methyltransferase
MNVNQQSFMQLGELGSRFPSYERTFEFPGEFINESHKFFSTCPLREGILIDIRDRTTAGSIIEGWLQRADALKLYEIAYFVTGDILELGSYHGLSTSILARAACDSPHKKNIFSVDLDSENVKMTNQHLLELGLKSNVITLCGDALYTMKELGLEGARFAFVFVDHSHSYEPVHSVCRNLADVLQPGAFCLFHDYNDARNRESVGEDYGVYQAVVGGLDSDRFEFYGIYGCAALYRFRD